MKSTLLELLKAEVVGDHPPVGWYTIAELMDRLGVKRGMVQSLVVRKKWDAKKYRTVTKDGKFMLAMHYHTGRL